MSRFAGAALSAVLFSLACAPADLSGSIEAMVYRLDPATRQYALARSPVENLESLRELRGRDLVLRSGGGIDSGPGGLQLSRGSPFELEWTQAADGVVLPGDLHSLYALSLYRNLDRVASLLRSHGHVPEAPLEVLYFPRMDDFILGDTRTSFTDNAAFVADDRVFLIVPSFVLADVPMFLNEGVMAHEFGHAVVDQEAFANAGSDVLSDNHVAAMHEGVADLIGFCATGDPNYIGPTVDIDRDLSVPRDYTPEDYENLLHPPEDPLLGAQFDPHHDGSLMARALYELWPRGPDGTISEEERGRMLDVILSALRSIDYGAGFTLGTFPNQVVAHLRPEEQEGACAVLTARLEPLVPALTHCGGL